MNELSLFLSILKAVYLHKTFVNKNIYILIVK